jgi:hypothetical protein
MRNNAAYLPESPIVYIILPKSIRNRASFTIFAKYCITFKNMTMEKTFAQISELFDQFSKDASLQVEKGNKAAGTRARKASLELEKLLKRFRKESLEASK